MLPLVTHSRHSAEIDERICGPTVNGDCTLLARTFRFPLIVVRRPGAAAGQPSTRATTRDPLLHADNDIAVHIYCLEET